MFCWLCPLRPGMHNVWAEIFWGKGQEYGWSTSQRQIRSRIQISPLVNFPWLNLRGLAWNLLVIVLLWFAFFFFFFGRGVVVLFQETWQVLDISPLCFFCFKLVLFLIIEVYLICSVVYIVFWFQNSPKPFFI